MNYFVILNGQQYGPADIPTLNQWIVDGRVTPETTLKEETSGTESPASGVPGLVFAPSAPAGPMEAPPGTQMTTSTGGPQQATPQYAAYPREQAMAGGALPPEIAKKFNWGAFMLNWIWGLNHKKPIMLLFLVVGCIPVVGLLVGIWFGTKGNEWAWESGRFSTVAEMEACEKVWATWGIVIFALDMVYVLFAIMLPLLARGSR